MSRNSTEFLFIVEYIKDVLYFATVRSGKDPKSRNADGCHYFSIDDDLVYENYYSDFGPLNLSCVYKYCKLLDEKIKHYVNKKKIVHYTTTDARKKANAAFLIGCYGVIYLSLSPKDALKPLLVCGQTYRPFQDACPGDSSYTISILDCLNAMEKARGLGFYNFQDFNYKEYDSMNRIENGDLNWIIPDKFVAFIGPVDNPVTFYQPPKQYIKYFRENNVRVVIRLNKRLYDSSVFTNAGIVHYDLFFPDGSCPSRNILMKFLQICEETEGALGVHCKAGLGRTGSLIGTYLIKHYRMSAHEAIAWMRICRPGSVIGNQQTWLEQLEPWLLKQGIIHRKRMFQDPNRIPTHEYGVYSHAAKKVPLSHDLLLKKHSSSSPPPPLQRHTPRYDRNDPRPKTSRCRALYSSPCKEAQDWCMKPHDAQSQQIPVSTQFGKSTRHGSGEPRSSRLSVRDSETKTNYSQLRHPSPDNRKKTPIQTTAYHPMASMQSNQMSFLSNLDDAKNFWMSSSKNASEKISRPIPKVSQSSFNNTQRPDTKIILSEKELASLSYRKVPDTSKGTDQTRGTDLDKTCSNIVPQNRRQLGRSPSPRSQSSRSSLLDRCRATNTPASIPAKRSFNSPNYASKERLQKTSQLNAGMGRDAASVGASSLGARRTAPPAPVAPSVRSDDRSHATQGDMLNSIKYQRQIREYVQKKKLSPGGKSDWLIGSPSWVKPNRSVILKDKSNTKDKTDRPVSPTVRDRPVRPTSSRERPAQDRLAKRDASIGTPTPGSPKRGPKRADTFMSQQKPDRFNTSPKISGERFHGQNPPMDRFGSNSPIRNPVYSVKKPGPTEVSSSSLAATSQSRISSLRPKSGRGKRT